MLNRWIEDGLLDVLGELGVGCIAFSPLAQGLLSGPLPARASRRARARRSTGRSRRSMLTDQALAKIRALNEIARRRGQTLAQMALAWTLRDPRVTSTLPGASSLEQFEANVTALDRLDFAEDELAEIDRYATESDINLW